jgi:hypothetical protein
MSLHRLADLVLVVHFAFLAFVVAGGVLVLRWPKLALLHLPAVVWGVLIELSGWICPLTPLENSLRHRAGEAGYTGGFIAHYVTRLLYPDGLTRGIQVVLGVAVLALNVAVYAVLIARRRATRSAPAR